jgi:hypothetical protein
MTDIVILLRDQIMRRDLWISSALQITRAIPLRHLDPLRKPLEDPLSCDLPRTIGKILWRLARRMADVCPLRVETQLL